MIIFFLGIIICLVVGVYYIGGWDIFIVNIDCFCLEVVNFILMGLEKGDEFGFWFMLIGGFFFYIFYYGID